MAYSRIADNTLCYFKDIISEVIVKKPELLKSKEKEQLDYIFSFENMADLISAITEKKISELFYGGIKDIKEYFSSRLGINIFQNEKDEKDFNHFLKQRNLIVHNRGIISKEFSKEFSNQQINYVVGAKLNFNYEQLSIMNGGIVNFISDLDVVIREKFQLSTIKSI